MRTEMAMGMDRSLVRAGERVCVALSGGADSVALLLEMLEANCGREPLGVVVSAAHVHHGLRGADADGDEDFVQKLCERLSVKLRVFRVDTAARQAAEREGMEEAARELRYEALRGLMASGSVDVVATAHTMDDQAETVMMKMLRGAWTEGLGAISPEVKCAGGKGRIVRPMLRVRRSQIEAFLQARGQDWREDETNRDVSFMRNRVRHELMPLLREFRPGVDLLLARTAEIARDEESYWQTEVARVLPQALLPGRPTRGGGRAVSTAPGEAANALEIARLAEMPTALRRRVVRAAAQALNGGAKRSSGGGYVLSAEETAKVLALAGLGKSERGERGSVKGRIGSRLELHDGLRVERSARELLFWRRTVEDFAQDQGPVRIR